MKQIFLFLFYLFIFSIFGFNFSVLGFANSVFFVAVAGIGGFIVNNLLEVNSRVIFRLGLDRFAILGFLVLLPFLSLILFSFQGFIPELSQVKIPFFADTVASGFAGLFFSSLVGVVHWVVNNEFISFEQRITLAAKLEIKIRDFYKPTTIITVVFWALLFVFYFFVGFSWLLAGMLFLFLFLCFTSVELSSFILFCFVLYFEYKNYIAEVSIQKIIFGVHSLIINNKNLLDVISSIPEINSGIYLLLAPFYFLIIALRFGLRTQMSKEIKEEYNTTKQKSPVVGGVYIGKRIQ